MSFGGLTYNPSADGKRLRRQFDRVLSAMADGQWRTLSEIASAANAPEASVSARLRDARKAIFGGHEVQRRRAARGLHLYRLLLPEGMARRGGGIKINL